MDQVMGKSEKEDVDDLKIAQVEMENDELATKVDQTMSMVKDVSSKVVCL